MALSREGKQAATAAALKELISVMGELTIGRAREHKAGAAKPKADEKAEGEEETEDAEESCEDCGHPMSECTCEE